MVVEEKLTTAPQLASVEAERTQEAHVGLAFWAEAQASLVASGPKQAA
jgi:hypothetical protein